MEFEDFYKDYLPIDSKLDISKMDFSRQLNKWWFVKTINWDTTTLQYNTLGDVILPSDVLVNDILLEPFRHACLYRAKMLVKLSTNGTPMHSGTVLCSIMPHGVGIPTVDSNVINSFSQGVHGKLFANQGNQIVLPVPNFHSTTTKCTSGKSFDSKFFNNNKPMSYGLLRLIVLNQLQAATGSSTTLTINVSVKFTDADFYVPKEPDLYTEVPITMSRAVREVSNKVPINTIWSKGAVKASKESGNVDPFIGGVVSYFAIRLVLLLGSVIYKQLKKDTDCSFTCVKKKRKESAESIFGDFTKAASSATTSLLDSSVAYAKTMTGDFIDMVRGTIRQYTGLHNPNVSTPVNKQYVQSRNVGWNSDKPVMYDRLDRFHGYTRVMQRPEFSTKVDEMSLNFITSKWQYLDTFIVKNSDPAGTMLFSRPITPSMSTFESTTQGATSNVLDLISSMAEAWSGDLEIMIESAMTSFQHLKLLVVRDYSNDPKVGASFPVSMTRASGLTTDEIECKGGGSQFCIDLPYRSDVMHLPVSLDAVVNAHTHGVFYIYLLQPLVISDAQPINCSFNVYVRAKENFCLYGYKPIMWSGPVNHANSLAARKQPLAAHRETRKIKEPLRCVAESKDVCDEGISSIVCPTEQQCQEPKVDNEDINNFPGSLRPIYNLRDIIRNVDMLFNYPYTFDGDFTSGNLVISVSELFRIYENFDTSRFSPAVLLRSLYFGHVGGVKLKLLVQNAANLNVVYIPPSAGCFAGTPAGILATDAGGLLVSRRDNVLDAETQHGVLTLSAPYIETPNLRSVTGKTLAYSGGAGINSRECQDFHVVEMEIPNQNVCNFVTKVSPFVVTNTLSPPGASTDMGHIHISFRPTVLVGSPEVNFGLPRIFVYGGWSDEARFGMYTYSAARTPASVVQGSKKRLDYPGYELSVLDRTDDTEASISKAYYTRRT